MEERLSSVNFVELWRPAFLFLTELLTSRDSSADMSEDLRVPFGEADEYVFVNHGLVYAFAVLNLRLISPFASSTSPLCGHRCCDC